MSEFQDLPDDEIIALAKGVPREESKIQFASFLDDYAVAEGIAAELMSSGEWEIPQTELLAKVKPAIKQKAFELQEDLPDFDTLEHPVNSKADLDAYAAAFIDFYNSVIDALEEKGRKII